MTPDQIIHAQSEEIYRLRVLMYEYRKERDAARDDAIAEVQSVVADLRSQLAEANAKLAQCNQSLSACELRALAGV